MSKRGLVPVNILRLAADPTVPTPVTGDVYFNTVSSVLRYYNGSAWADLGGSGSYAATVSATPPSSPTTGQVWLDTTAPGLDSAPGVSVYQDAATTSFTTATDTVCLFNAEVFDTHGFHSLVTNTSRLTVPTGLGGLYHIEATLAFAANTSGYREADIRKNNAEVLRSRVQPLTSAVAVYVPVSGYLDLAAGDYIELFGIQNSGSTIASVSGTSWTRLQMIRVRANI